MAEVKVSKFLGLDIFFDANKGKFSAVISGGLVTSGKTIDEVEKAIAESFRPKTSVKVIAKPYVGYDNKVDTSFIKDFKVHEIEGIEIERGRGRAAGKTLYYKLAEGGPVGIRAPYFKYDESVVEDMRRLAEDRRAADKEFVARAQAIYDRMEKVEAEEIFEQLQNQQGGDERRLKVV